MSHITNTVEIPFTITGGMGTGIVGAGTDTLSGYTCSLTEFEFTADTVPNYISNDKFVWDLGDGTIVNDVSASHIYTWPGRYNVSLVGFSSAGVEYLSTQTKEVSVSNLYEDQLIRNSTDKFNLVFIPAGKINTSNAIPIDLERHNSWQSERTLSATGGKYTVTVGASGSRSRRLNVVDYDQDKWNHLDQTWSFYKTVTADNLVVSYQPIDRVETTNDYIYYQSQIVWDNDASEFVHILKHVPTSTANTLSSTSFVGTSGTCVVYYADDKPSVGNDKIIASMTLDSMNMLDKEDVQSGHTSKLIPDFSNFSFGPAVNVMFKITSTTPTKLIFTSSGVSTMSISPNKWQHCRLPFVAGTSTAGNSVVTSFPALSGQPVQSGVNPSTSTNVINLSVISSTNTTMSAEFFRVTDNQLPSQLNGTYRGLLIPRDSGDDCKLAGDVTLNVPAAFTREAYFGFLGNSDYDRMYRIISQDRFSVDSDTGSIVYDWGTCSTLNSVVSGETLPFAVIPTGNTTGDLNVKCHFSTTTNGTLSTVDTYGNVLSGLDLKNITLGFGALSGTQYNLINASTGDVNDLPISSMGIDSSKNVWFTLPDNNVIGKIRDSDGSLTQYFSKTGNTSIATVSGGGYLYEPGIVDTDVDDNIWVAYTHRLSSFVAKYSPAGSELATYEFPENVVPQDMIVDRAGNVWVATVDHDRIARDTITAEVYADTSTAGHFCYYIGTGSGQGGQAGQNPTVSTWQVGEILDIEYPVTNTTGARLNYSGKFLITSSEAKTDYRYKVCAQPYTGRYDTTRSLVASASMSFGVKPSDKVYKLDSTGSVIYAVSGFYKPAYITVDDEQNCWVAHNVNTASKINTTTGSIDESIRIESSNYLTLCAANFDASQYDVQQIGGIACDTSNTILTINSPENLIFKNNVTTPTVSSTTTIDVNALSGTTMHRAMGDWTGWRWINKYAYRESGVITLTGETTLNIYPSGGKYHAGLLFEDFDPAETIKSYRFQNQLLDYQKLFDSFYGQIVGTAESNPNTIGKAIYYKIANFSSNHSNVDECNIDALYSLCQQYSVPIDKHNYNFTGGLKRVMDMTSIPHHRLWGTRSKFNRNFNKEGTNSPLLGVNLGNQISTQTYIVSAGTYIVAEQLFNREYSLVNTMYISGGSGEPGYSAAVGMLSSYPLSGYTPGWGWALYNSVTGTDIGKYYKFYEYNPVVSDIQLEGLIDWSNTYTDIIESNSGIDAWVKDDGMIDAMIEYELRSGLDLFMSSISGSSSTLW